MENSFAAKHPELVCEWSEKNLPLTPEQIPYGSNKIYWWHGACGHEWTASAKSRHAGEKCPICSGTRILVGFNDFQTLCPELAEEWSERNAPLMPDRISVKSRQNVWWKCKVCGHEWKSVIYFRTKGTTCPVCADRAVKEGYNDLATTDPHLIPEWDFEQNKKFSPYHISRNSLYSVWWRCKHGHTWKAIVADRAINGEGCRICEAEYQWAFPKLLIGYYAKKEGLKVRLDSEKDIGIRLETYLPDERIAIETTGKSARQNSDRERIKDYICSRQGIRLFRVPYEQAHEEEYNVQPGINIDYATGDSSLIDQGGSNQGEDDNKNDEPQNSSTQTYILNTNTHKFHLPSCSSVGQMSEKNKQEFTGSRDEVIAQGYEPCKKCNP